MPSPRRGATGGNGPPPRAFIPGGRPPSGAAQLSTLAYTLPAAPGGLEGLIVAGVVTTLLAGLSVRARALTLPAAGVAMVFGWAILFLGGIPYLALLILFVLAGTLATRYGWAEKQARKLAEGRDGQRGVSNVLAHILVPLGITALLPFNPLLETSGLAPFVYVSALACGTADTFASEFGVLSGKARSILTLRPVPAGTNGGVSAGGELWAFLGALVTLTVGSAFFFVLGSGLATSATLWFVGGTLLGFVGCQIDSVLGLTLENRGYLGKGSVNFLAMLLTALLAVGWLKA
jgi:uncharacterized protein (TIGR00297 family)